MLKDLSSLFFLCVFLWGCAPMKVSDRKIKCLAGSNATDRCDTGNQSHLVDKQHDNAIERDEPKVMQPTSNQKSALDLYQLCARVKDRLVDLDKERTKAEGAIIAANGPKGDRFDLIRANNDYTRITEELEALIPPYARSTPSLSSEDIAKFKRCDKREF
jgi:hypothetical protein